MRVEIKCVRCGELKRVDDFNKKVNKVNGVDSWCKECKAKHSLEASRTLIGKLKRIYNKQKSKNFERGHGDMPYSQDEFVSAMNKDVTFVNLYNEWAKSDFDTMLAPSVDRIDSKLGYSFDNIQVVTWKDNLIKSFDEKAKKKCYIHNTKDKTVKMYESFSKASLEEGHNRHWASKIKSRNTERVDGVKIYDGTETFVAISDYTDYWQLIKDTTMKTIGLSKGSYPTSEWKTKILKSEHSPIRLLTLVIDLYNVPYFVQGHLTRHKHGVEFYCSTQRTDRVEDELPREQKSQNAPVNIRMIINAQAMINISRKRLCTGASKETRELWQAVVEAVRTVEPELAELCVRECVYRGGKCPEFFNCGYMKNKY